LPRVVYQIFGGQLEVIQMPKKGFKVISVHEENYQQILDLANCLGWSIAKTIETASEVYAKSDEFQSHLNQAIKEHEEELKRLKALKVKA